MITQRQARKLAPRCDVSLQNGYRPMLRARQTGNLPENKHHGGTTMRRFLAFAAILSVAAAIIPTTPSNAEESGKTTVTVDNFVRAATDLEFGKYLARSGGVNRFSHFREPTPIDNQPTIRMNRDTLYSSVIVDISEGATLTLPDSGTRYMTAMVVNQDHYINQVFFGGGTYKLDLTTFGTPHVIVIIRMLVDAADPADIAKVNALQDKIKLEAASAKPFAMPDYDMASFDAVLKASLDLSRSVPDSFRTFGAKKDVDPIRHFLGTAFGWGGLPEREAFYLNVNPGLPVGAYKIEVPADVPVDAFWSVSLYNAKGFFEPNDRNAYSVNSVTGKRNADGTTTVHLGACDDGRLNCLPIMDGWNYAVRMYRPHKEILEGTWTFPDPVALP